MSKQLHLKEEIALRKLIRNILIEVQVQPMSQEEKEQLAAAEETGDEIEYEDQFTPVGAGDGGDPYAIVDANVVANIAGVTTPLGTGPTYPNKKKKGVKY